MFWLDMRVVNTADSLVTGYWSVASSPQPSTRLSFRFHHARGILGSLLTSLNQGVQYNVQGSVYT